LHRYRDDKGRLVYSNSAYFFTPEGVQFPPYDKVKLVPFSEHLPYSHKLTWLGAVRDFFENQLGLDISDFRPGDSQVVYQTYGRGFGPLICFEVVYPDYVRKMIAKGADFLVVITNDAWFGETAGPHQHAAIPIFRSVETRSWLARAANTGISEIIDPFGRVVARSDLGERAQLTESIGGRLKDTIFVKYGLWLSKLCLAVALLWLPVLFIWKPRDA
jgi:apolipoprotein N-acyltransferase